MSNFRYSRVINTPIGWRIKSRDDSYNRFIWKLFFNGLIAAVIHITAFMILAGVLMECVNLIKRRPESSYWDTITWMIGGIFFSVIFSTIFQYVRSTKQRKLHEQD